MTLKHSFEIGCDLFRFKNQLKQCRVNRDVTLGSVITFLTLVRTYYKNPLVAIYDALL